MLCCSCGYCHGGVLQEHLAAPAADQGLLATHDSLVRSSSSSSSFTEVHESPRSGAAAAAAAACTSPHCLGSIEQDAAVRMVEQGPSGRLSQATEQPCVTSLSPPRLEPQQELAGVSPRQPGSCAKAVTFYAQNKAMSPAAAAAVAAAAADARPHVASQQQLQQSAAAGLPPCEDGAGEEVVFLAAEEDIPTSLWLPEFAALSRPTTAAADGSSLKGGTTARCGRVARPSSAAAALGGSLHSRAAAHSSVLSAAGRSSVALGPAAGAVGGAWGRSKGIVEQGGAAGRSIGRPHSAGALQRRHHDLP
jgi:hypothetical protein